MRNMFNEELQVLNEDMISMGNACEEAIRYVEQALTQEDMSYASKVSPIRQQLYQKEKHIESLCYRLLLLQQPMAGDLRYVSASLQMLTDMYRIGEVAEDASQIILSMNRFHKNLDTGELAQSATKMVHDAVESFVNKDDEEALKVIAADDHVDEVFLSVKKELIEKIIANTSEAEEYVDLLMIAKYFEKIGDHAVSIAKWVGYAKTGYHQ